MRNLMAGYGTCPGFGKLRKLGNRKGKVGRALGLLRVSSFDDSEAVASAGYCCLNAP